MLTDAQKQMRRDGMGGSEIAAIVGLNEWMTPLDVWRAKVEGYEQPVTEDMKRGSFLEPGMADWYADRTGAELGEIGTVFHPSISRVFCTPDRLARKDGDAWDLSIKVPGPRATGWGAAGSDEVPMSALLQVQWELLVLEPLCGVSRAELAALVWGELRIFKIAADPDLQGQLLVAAQKFWRDFVETKTPPPLDGSESAARWLAHKFPEERAPLLPPTPEADAIMRRLKAIRDEAAKLETAEREATNALKAIVGESEGMAADEWKFTWRKPAKGSRRFVPQWRDAQ